MNPNPQFSEPTNHVGMDGIEFAEYATSQPQAFGAVLEQMGFAQVARHRSREVLLYRQGSMNIIVNAHPDSLPGLSVPGATPVLSAFALRVRDAAYAYHRALDLGAWEVPTRVSAMELNIPGIHGVGDSVIYFVDRYRDFSIYDVDFVPLVGAPQRPSALAGLHCFGLVQAVLPERTGDWVDFYQTLFGFSVLPKGKSFGVLPHGTLLESPCRKFYLQLVEPAPDSQETLQSEGLARLGLGAPDIREATHALQERGIVFVDRGAVQPSDKGALTQMYLGGANFELVASHLHSGR